MNVREKLVELLAPTSLNLEEAVYLADYLVKNGVTVQEWISVDDRLPELHTNEFEDTDGSRVQYATSDEQLVVTTSGFKTKAVYETNENFCGWSGDNGDLVRDVTHWMPLPPAPKGE